MRPEPWFTAAATLLALHVSLWMASTIGMSWSRPTVLALWLAATVAVVAQLARAWSKRTHLGSSWISFPMLVLGIGLAGFGALALATWQGWNVHPDWAFHWGPKAQRFALAQGVDIGFLSQPWNTHIHPDYPLLLPNLTASLALAMGQSVTPRLGGAVTLLFAAIWWAALRALAFRVVEPTNEKGRWIAEASWLTAAWSVTMFGTGFRQAAGADLPFACAITLGALALSASQEELREGYLWADARVAIAAGLASQIKFEGSVFAAILIVLWCLRRLAPHPRERGARRFLTAGLRAGLLPALLIGLWAFWNQRYGLFQPSNAGSLDLGRLPVVAQGILHAAWERAWHGLPLCVAALPWLCLRQDTRWPAILLSGQLFVYIGVYLTTPVDLELLLLTSASRLLFHLVPTLLVLLVVALGRGGKAQPLELAAGATVTSSGEPVRPTFLA
ncbi:MAG: hypothetical protein MPN21_04505 [Thermoanaerobaculia bacterium]|nr:hypothetical protein [Thermoanaerobaculia bacterium]